MFAQNSSPSIGIMNYFVSILTLRAIVLDNKYILQEVREYFAILQSNFLKQDEYKRMKF